MSYFTNPNYKIRDTRAIQNCYPRSLEAVSRTGSYIRTIKINMKSKNGTQKILKPSIILKSGILTTIARRIGPLFIRKVDLTQRHLGSIPRLNGCNYLHTFILLSKQIIHYPAFTLRTPWVSMDSIILRCSHFTGPNMPIHFPAVQKRLENITSNHIAGKKSSQSQGGS